MAKRMLVVLFVLALVAAACSSDDSSDTTTTADTGGETTTTTTAAPDETTTTAAPAEGDVTLRWRTRPDNDQEAGVYQNVSDSLQGSLDGVTLQYEAGGTETEGYQQALLTQLSAGEAPDVFWIPGADIAEFASKGVIYNLAPLANADDTFQFEDFYPGPMEQMTTDPATGQSDPANYLWGLPRDVSAFALYMNLDLIAEAGADDPRELAEAGTWDWAAFTEVSEAIAALDTEIFGYGQSSWWGPVGWWLNSAGGGFFNEARDACGLDTPESIEGLAAFRDFFAGGSGFTYGEDPEPVFKAGNIGMFQNGRWATPGIREVDFNWDVVKLPDGPGGPSNWLFWGAYVVNANTENPQAAWDLVKALTSAEVQAQVAELGANIPSRVSQDALDAFLTFTPPENNQAFLDGLGENPVTEAPLWNGDWPSYRDEMNTRVNAVVTGDLSIEEYEANICTDLNQYFDN
ncbi:ABC transporter substrate-binding protein [Actinomycetota bacterium]